MTILAAAARLATIGLPPDSVWLALAGDDARAIVTLLAFGLVVLALIAITATIGLMDIRRELRRLGYSLRRQAHQPHPDPQPTTKEQEK